MTVGSGAVTTTGINWEAISAVAFVVYTPAMVVVPVLWRKSIRAWNTALDSGLRTRLAEALEPIRRELADLVHTDQIQEVRIARLEAFQEGKQFATAQLTAPVLPGRSVDDPAG